MENGKLIFEKKLPRGHFFVYQSQPHFELIRVKQTHSNIVLNEKHCQGLEADGIVGNSSTPLAILTADCLPVVLLGKTDHAFIHAGWRGLHNEILNNELIQKINPFYAFIGPHISVMNYEVQSDFRNNFNVKEAFIEQNGKLYFDLSKVVQKQLQSFYPEIEIEISEDCTFSNHNLHSYRRNKTTERNWNIYRP